MTIEKCCCVLFALGVTFGADSAVRTEAERLLKEGAYAGAAVVATGTEPVFVGNQGVSPEAGPVTAATRFDLASCSKTIVATVCAVLAAEGKLDVDAPFTRYLPEHCLAATNHGIRVRDLALHTSGFRTLPTRRYRPGDNGGPEGFLRDVMNARPVEPPRKTCSYQCTNFILLGLVAERAGGKPLDVLAKEKVFDPIGMRNARWWPVANDGHVVRTRLKGWFEPGTNDLVGVVHDELARFAGRPVGNAGVFATLEDMRLFVEDLLNRRALPQKAYDLLFTCGCEDEKSGERRSFGFDMGDTARRIGLSRDAIFHTGFTGQLIVVDPANRFAGVALTLRQTGNPTGLAARRALLAAALADSRATAPVSRIDFAKPVQRWLWGGFGFHNSEATMLPLMTEEFRDQRVLKTFREISPTYSRVFAGFANWTKAAMDSFADYYDATFRRAGTTLYVVPGRMPVITADFDARAYSEAVAERLAYLVNERKCTKLRYYCVANELSVGPVWAWFSSHRDLYAELNREMFRAFSSRGLGIGLQTPDAAGYNHVPDVEWALQNLNAETEVYCWHLYDLVHEPGDPAVYGELTDALTNLVRLCNRKEKRVSLGEFGFCGRHVAADVSRMRDDAHEGFRNPDGEFARGAAMARAEMGLAALNAGAVSAVSWTMVDYPDPFLREDGDTPEEKRRYDVARFSGHGLDVRYNKNGLFRWCDDERDYSAYADLYTMGYLVKLFRKGGRVLPWTTADSTLRAGGITNPDGSASFAVVNWGGEKTVELAIPHPLGKPLRVYAYDSSRPPRNAFNDLQPPRETVSVTNGFVSVFMPAKAMLFLTTDYEDRRPAAVAGLRKDGGRLVWDASPEPEHCYYRVYRDGLQVASTVATSFPVKGDLDSYAVRSVDKWGNLGK